MTRTNSFSTTASAGSRTLRKAPEMEGNQEKDVSGAAAALGEGRASEEDALAAASVRGERGRIRLGLGDPRQKERKDEAEKGNSSSTES